MTERNRGQRTGNGGHRTLGVALILALLAICCGGCIRKTKAPPIRVGSKASIENAILGQMLTHLVRHAGVEAEHQYALGGTRVVFNALVKGELDVYPEYTGTLIAEILQGQRIRNEEDLRRALADHGLTMSEPLGFNNTYAIGLKESLASTRNVAKISDLARTENADLMFAFSDEFMHRGDGWPGLKATYQLPFQPKTMDHNLAYRGIETGSIGVTDLYSTDAEIALYKLRVLEDDRGYFPPYHCVLLYRNDLETRLPQAVQALKQLQQRIDNAAMTEMNARAKLDHVADRQVAADFLKAQLGLDIRLPPEPSLLLATTQRHLFLVGISLAAAVLIAVPLGIWSYKWPKLGHAILATVGILQTLPSMAVLVLMMPLLGIGWKPAIAALFLYSLLPIVRGTVTGLREIPNHLKESAVVLGLTPRARLWLVELPMASRSILSGIKTAAVINVGTATIGAMIGAGGYGEPIFTGIRLENYRLVLQGAVPAAVMALLVQAAFEAVEPFLVPRGLRLAAAGKG
jgi:osmoprotectant transport system permease protein